MVCTDPGSWMRRQLKQGWGEGAQGPWSIGAPQVPMNWMTLQVACDRHMRASLSLELAENSVNRMF